MMVSTTTKLAPQLKLCIVVLIITIALVTISFAIRINDIADEQEAVRNLNVEVESYDIRFSDVDVNYLFSNVTTPISGHIEAQAYKLTIENRTVVNQTVNAVDIVDIIVDKGQTSIVVEYEDIIPTDDHYIIEAELVTRTMVRRLPEVYIFEKEEI